MPLKKLLLVDDSEAEQFLYKAIIENFDAAIEVVSAFDGQEALEILERASEKPCGILLDLNMPRMNGFDFLDIYSQKHSSSSSFVAMLTSSNQESDKDKAMSYACVSEFFVKPIKTEELEKLAAMIG